MVYNLVSAKLSPKAKQIYKIYKISRSEAEQEKNKKKIYRNKSKFAVKQFIKKKKNNLTT